VLLAVSGGADSLGLLLGTSHVAGGLGLRVEAACVDHGLRPEASLEQAAVGALCERLGVPFHPLKVEVAGRGNLEGAARAARYAALESCRAARSLSRVATGHTRDDQVETLLLRLGRGADLRGAGAIREVRGAVVRPLLELGRAELRAWVTGQGAVPVEDPMNRDPRFGRVRVRQQVLPAVESALGPGALAAMARFAARAAEDEAWLEGEARAALQRLALEGGGWDGVGLGALPFPLRRRAVRALLEAQGGTVDAALLERALTLLHVPGRLTLPGARQLRSAGGRVRVVHGPGAPPQGTSPLPSGQWLDHAASGWQLGVDVPGAASWAAPVHCGPLTVRGPLPGDQLCGGGRLQDLLVDARVPAEHRPHLPVIACADGRVACVVGVGPGSPGTHTGERFVRARPQDGRAVVRQAGYTFVLEGGAEGSAE